MDFLSRLIDIVKYFWPFVIVHEWENGAYYRLGRYWKTMGPGLKVVAPFFTECHVYGVVPGVMTIPLQTIETKAGSLTFSAIFRFRVLDLGLAMNSVEYWQDTAAEDAAAILAEKLAEVDPEMLGIEKRARLVSGCLQRLKTTLATYGLEPSELRFNNWVPRLRAYRLFNDSIAHGMIT